MLNLPSPLTSVFVGLLAAGIVGCQSQPNQEETAVDTAAVKAELDSLRSAYEKAYAEGDIEKAVRAVAHSEVTYSPPYHSVIQGRDSAIAHERQVRPPEATLDVNPMEVEVLSPEWVYEFGTATVSFTPEGEESDQSVESTYLILFRKTADGWKSYRESISSNQPPQNAP